MAKPTRLQGRDLIITMKKDGETDYTAIACSTDCKIEVTADLQETASPTSGAWKHYTTKRKGWKVSCSYIQLLENFDDAQMVGQKVMICYSYSPYDHNNAVGEGSERTEEKFYEGEAYVQKWSNSAAIKGKVKGGFEFTGNGSLDL